MPRHERPSGKEFLQSRQPRVLFVHPEPEWVLDSYRVRSWYYRDAPAIGDKVTYLRDGFATRVTSVNFFRIGFASGTSMRRPELGRRLVLWVLPRLQNLIPKTPVMRTRAASRTNLHPDATTVLV